MTRREYPEHKYMRFTYAPTSMREGYIRQYTFAYTTEEELEKLVLEHLVCDLCKEDLTRELDPNDPGDWKPETTWGTPCMCEWDEQVISKEDIYAAWN